MCIAGISPHQQQIVIKDKSKHTLSHQEVRFLGEVSFQIEQILTLVFENYKSLDESSPSGIKDVFGPATGVAAPALDPALKLYKMLHDILSPEIATRKRSMKHLFETDEFFSTINENILLNPVAVSTAYMKMKNLCMVTQDVKAAVKNEDPLVKSLMLSSVTFCIETSNTTPMLKVHKEYVPTCMESLNDETPDVRNASFSALADIAKVKKYIFIIRGRADEGRSF
ncbi:uncharacterized protein LOC121743805 [Salvia splendens]|uniref:uncharacterized protein LOC121743805 n=1 Tax=Salvia splendens TaxID=180675 RepID=UPI001C269A7A|nr:uncharacterized protein LOC121743805 [Salvia splendens]